MPAARSSAVLAASLAAAAALASPALAAPAEPVELPPPVTLSACDTTLRIEMLHYGLNERTDQATGTKTGSGRVVDRVTDTVTGRSFTFTTAGRRVGTIDGEVFSLTASGRYLLFPLTAQEVDEFERVGLPPLSVATGRLAASWGPTGMHISELPNRTDSVCHLLR